MTALNRISEKLKRIDRKVKESTAKNELHKEMVRTHKSLIKELEDE